ncbi:MAG: hypothetical protein AB7D29_09255 [Campylobacterales bacterium]
MSVLLEKISNIFSIFKKNNSSCNGCAYHKEATNECNLFLITEEYKTVKAKDGCDSYLAKEQLLRR